MDKQQNQQRIKSIYRMLLEIATGNLNYRMTVEGNDAQFDELANRLNEVAYKLQEVGYTSPYKNSKNDLGESTDTTVIMVQKALEYIQNHLEEPLPSAKTLSKMFGTNEFTLKDNFRRLVNTSIYQFYNDERLKKSHTLIEKTTIPLKEIALLSGFTNYTNFYKAFKKKFNYPPSELNRTDADL
jgi:transcriptional regulator GlxA family with amidase domain